MIVKRFIRTIAKRFFSLIQIAVFVSSGSGKSFGISKLRKLQIALRIRRNCQHPGCASMFFENLVLADAIFAIPNELSGCVAEFGSYKGISSANLSIACKVAKRKLLIFDSFRGLPDIQEEVKNITNGKVVSYKVGGYVGEIEEVKRNIHRLGNVDVCEFVPGYFSQTLPHRPVEEKYVMIFEDADLPSSVRDVLENTWHKLQPSCKFFSHEARDREVVKLFFDDFYWQQKFGEKAPGLVGSGTGIPLELGMGGNSLGLNLGSYLAYTSKKDFQPKMS